MEEVLNWATQNVKWITMSRKNKRWWVSTSKDMENPDAIHMGGTLYEALKKAFDSRLNRGN